MNVVERLATRGGGQPLTAAEPSGELMKELRTRRLRLEPLEERHTFALFHGSRHDGFYEFIHDRLPEGAEPRDRHQSLSTRISPDGREAWLNWALRLCSGERYLGYVQATVHPDQSASIAYALFHDAWGHGYVREALAALIEHLRENWRTIRVLANADTRSLGAIRLLEALGFRRDAARSNAELSDAESLLDDGEYSLRIMPQVRS